MRLLFLYLIIHISFINVSCTGRCPSFFQNSGGAYDSLAHYIFTVTPQKDSKGQCLYKHSFKSWRGIKDSIGNFIPSFELKGQVINTSKAIYIIPEGTSDTITYFDFSLDIKESRAIVFRMLPTNNSDHNFLFQKKYLLSLDTTFKSRELNEKIYKFRFNHFGFQMMNDDLVFFVSKESGVLGIYASVFDLNIECELSHVGKINFYELHQTLNSNCGNIQ
ncbi:MAG: hypothetical protein J0H29_23845 [Sphingobacteriales bacterium]|nr:hypothetical protein [Sphingobacteriales bacterium]